jgi:hypothetical protein
LWEGFMRGKVMKISFLFAKNVVIRSGVSLLEYYIFNE